MNRLMSPRSAHSECPSSTAQKSSQWPQSRPTRLASRSTEANSEQRGAERIETRTARASYSKVATTSEKWRKGTERTERLTLSTRTPPTTSQPSLRCRRILEGLRTPSHSTRLPISKTRSSTRVATFQGSRTTQTQVKQISIKDWLSSSALERRRR